ncbi:2-oxoglutarate dehydrogenase complex dihydrolipoyllysine-residue succinyltransferase [Kingella negevensis]|uniref:Dihydrolipoyllysine-residue succinyltransferase n=1 Tax=Kingella negevensis TaxID=1522312 RepID=A0A238TAX3_9NEIS|nr:2-oxoglutarate dehydrogenase complex dihydrolipoyllysine-residue succinyltransferase [Kingella negevensis]MDK4698327.1 2-oxoglutarate dehydrogenase complex dihydrolipoyllysine-residue succinyltransferase [Kingella negevensis]SNB70752.1 Dihydrolipoyllysine-residue succinyltransferase component of 2-oxoglutarate dehydrogenase complex [Kingella negevensis]
MIIEVKVPVFSESISEGTLLTWYKTKGDTVARDEVLADIETDKVVLEVPAPQAGVLVDILLQEGDTVTSQQILAHIDTEAQETQPENTVSEAVAPAAETPVAETTPVAEDTPATEEPPVFQAATVLPNTERSEQRVPMSRLRARVAERLLESQAQNAILTTFNEVNMKPIMDLRAKYKEKFEKEHGVKLGFMSFFVKAAVAALKKFPIVNASVDGEDIIYHGYFDIGIAIGSPRGLVVPILRDADQMSIAEIEQTIANFAQKAKEGKIAIEDLTGGTFSITNGGTFGSMLSTPIINPPQSAILGMHATKDRAMVENGEIVIRPMMYLALSYDHRIIDGREAVLALVAIKDALEDPARLLLDL